MAINVFKPEIWSAVLMSALKKAHVFAQSDVVNRDYEGDIQAFGDTVRITSISDPTVGDYVANTTSITYEELTDAQRTLMIDQAKYFGFEVDDVDARQALGGVMNEAMQRAAYKLRDAVDTYIAGLYTSVPSVNAVGTVAVPVANPSYAYDKVLVPLSVKLDEANVPSEGRWVVMPPWLYGRLRMDDRFTDVGAAGGGATLRSGLVGDAAGFSIYKSNNTVLVTGDDYAVMAGTNMAISFAEQVNQVEAFRSQDSFADRVRGLHLWGAKVLRPEGLAYAAASIT